MQKACFSIFIYILLSGIAFASDQYKSSPYYKYYMHDLVKAESGDKSSLQYICDQYKNYGVIFVEDKSRVFKLLHTAAQNGDSCSQHSVGRMYSVGLG